jgi:polyisoprenoid-binding protein YceI
MRWYAPAAVLAALALTTNAQSQSDRPPEPIRDPSAAAPGQFRLDERHAAVLARAQHSRGVSFTVVRFDTAKGRLDWNPSEPGAMRLDVTVDPESLVTNVPGFADLLTGPGFLDTARHPEARFVSTSVQQSAPGRAAVTGELTLMGVTRPVTFNAQFVGLGRNVAGREIIGFSAETRFRRQEFGLQGHPTIGDEIHLQIDVEFIRT